MSWSCDTGTEVFFDDTAVGLTSHGSCQRVGEDTTTWEGFWMPSATSSLLDGAVCCL
jgi:hypothetical protein